MTTVCCAGRPNRTVGSAALRARVMNNRIRHLDMPAPRVLHQYLVGLVYVAFVVDAYARRIIGGRSGTTMTARLLLDVLEQAAWTRA
jgi:transposase InsO family protein